MKDILPNGLRSPRDRSRDKSFKRESRESGRFAAKTLTRAKQIPPATRATSKVSNKATSFFSQLQNLVWFCISSQTEEQNVWITDNE